MCLVGRTKRNWNRRLCLFPLVQDPVTPPYEGVLIGGQFPPSQQWVRDQFKSWGSPDSRAKSIIWPPPAQHGASAFLGLRSARSYKNSSSDPEWKLNTAPIPPCLRLTFIVWPKSSAGVGLFFFKWTSRGGEVGMSQGCLHPTIEVVALLFSEEPWCFRSLFAHALPTKVSPSIIVIVNVWALTGVSNGAVFGTWQADSCALSRADLPSLPPPPHPFVMRITNVLNGKATGTDTKLLLLHRKQFY